MTDVNSKQHVVVVGAGIVGVSTAIWLARAGRAVTLLDRLAPGEGTSHGNAGILAACAMVPVTVPGLISKAPGYLFDKNFPLFLRWSYLPRLAPWLKQYLSYANDTDTPQIAEGLTTIVADSVEQHQALAGNTAADSWLVPSDYQFAYLSKDSFDADSYVWNLRRRAGFNPELVTGAAVHEKEPLLGPDINLLAVCQDHGYVRSPGRYVKTLAEVFKELGGKVRQADVLDFEHIDGKVSAVHTSSGTIECTNLVLATGVWSAELGRKLGVKIPLESERGYHVIFKNPSAMVNSPTMVTTGKFVATPMHDGMRCAGIVELGGLDAGPSRAPLELLMRQAKKTFPDLTYSDTEEWLGHRPAPADSLPFIGEIGSSGVYMGLGHHHIGLTGGPKTGRMISDLITGDLLEDDIAPFNPMRFTPRSL